MAQTPAWQDFQFVSATALNAAQAQVAWSFADANLSLFHPGLINAASISLSHALLVVSASFGTTVRCLFGAGILSGFYGTTADASSGSYSVNMASLVPGSGSVTAYILAETYSLGEQQTTITGPTPGHPDFDPTFLPYTANLEGLDSAQLVASLVAPNNVTTFEVCRMTLTSGSTAITNFSTAYQYFASALTAPHGTQNYETPGTYSWVVPPGVTEVEEVIVTGGGGGASECDGTTPGGTYFSGGGSGAGGTSIKRRFAVTPGETFTIVVGAGGTSQLTGGGSSFSNGSSITMIGNGGGGTEFASPSISAGEQGGTATGGDINIQGGCGSDGQEGSLIFAGNGGASYWGGGGRAAAGGSSPSVQNGIAPGAGAGGAYNAVLSPPTSGVGGTGGPGICCIRW